MKRIGILMVVAALIVGAALFVYQANNQPAAQAASLQTARVERGTILASVSEAGTISARAQVNLVFQTSGQVKRILVQEGDRVSTGQKLAELEATDLRLQVAQAQASLALNEARLAQVKAGPMREELAAAQAAVESAQALYDAEKAKLGVRGQQITIAKADMEKAAVAVQRAQADYDKVAMLPGAGALPQAVALQQATIDYERAAANYALQLATINDVAFKNAAAQLAQAQANLEKLRRMPTKEDLAIVQAQVDQARLSLQQAQYRLEQATLVAPFAGTISTVNVKEGQWMPLNATAMQIVDLSTLEIKVDTDEVNVAKVKPGQSAIITLDAFPEQSFDGQVSRVGTVGTTAQGVVNYVVTVSLAATDASVKPGMTANVHIIVARKDNALLVPARAVRASGKQKVVQVLRGDQVEEVAVEVGLGNENQVEIVKGLQEGDEVVINVTPTNNPLRGGFFGLGRPQSPTPTR